jgi:hypothetical protein
MTNDNETKALRNVKLKGCEARSAEAKAGRLVKVSSRYVGGRPRFLRIKALTIECPHCAAAPLWGCYVRHSRKRAAEIGRETTPLHLTQHEQLDEEAGVAVHGSRRFAAQHRAAKKNPERPPVRKKKQRSIIEAHAAIGLLVVEWLRHECRKSSKPGEFDIISEEAAP